MFNLIDCELCNINNSKFKSFYIYGRWCPRRNLEASKLHTYLIINNLKAVHNPKKADIIIIFTCGVYERDEEYSIATIENSLKNKNAKTIITGCLPKIAPKKLRRYSDALIIYPENLDMIDQLINAKTLYKDISNFAPVDDIHDMFHGKFINILKRKARFESLASRILERHTNRKNLSKSKGSTTFSLFNSPTTYRLEIARGCVSNCSYCAIKLASEKFHSFTENQILADFNFGIRNGYSDFVLISGDIGCYGLDIKTNLAVLLRKLFVQESDFKLLLWDLNARWFVEYYEELCEVLKTNAEKVSKIVVPIQSGSNRILRLMNRGYEIEKVKKCILDLQKKIPEIKIDTHIIVGFPGETDGDFQKSLELVKCIDFFEVAVFKYEDRPNTKASEFPEKVPKKIINKRARILAKEARGHIVN